MSHKLSRWALPAGIDELLPEQAARVEQLRTAVLNQFHGAGYDLVIPPLVEFVDSLLVGAGEDLALDTLQMTDGLTGRQLGLRADMTPQIARIDAHSMAPTTERRLCYLGTVVRARPDGLGGSRTPMQVGAELYGVAAVEGDLEIISLMLNTLKIAGIEPIVLDLGHVDVFGSLAEQAGLNAHDEEIARDALQRKSNADLQALLTGRALTPAVLDALMALSRLNGAWGAVLAQADQVLAGVMNPSMRRALDRLQKIAVVIEQNFPQVSVLIDLSELHGYHYQTGLVFAAYAQGVGREIARGGRYDDIGEAFGRARPATGFSTDLRALLRFYQAQAQSAATIFAPADYADAELLLAVERLRARGQRVVMTTQALPATVPQLVRQAAGGENLWQLMGDTNHG
ncbi:MAG: ATP phosphoribosyltransferase regulatory subunit [Halothiobacillus sp. 24-54-40]|nr:ATP phosphoribosyltransferase regulatory subunit [Halothiobacillaceae bacterium]OYY44276.1 MAG: ATP phosphoribosyltransferase regulatory subunit [Halothiobacillus sp. 35-54-62]OYY54198.1 MAG: ATP phosphoribosyltransferase regulatory subunit [Halothiobacillus sp. 28-55-5]OYZ88392.1 MAG: ATP phosphoribosyltransferase regulatory subunit [Halothiobacillus sp. 24-54-40]OZA81700.1 MAG: ATP phosphoribosyltransferase regulatory subunit [Halothiobacillus sp. 39-53-45]HQS01807.1 ATP phosphoribosyltra